MPSQDRPLNRARFEPLFHGDLATLQSLGMDLPSPAYIFGAIVFGLIELAAFRRVSKSGRRRTLWLGVALLIYPYAISRVWLLYAVGVALAPASSSTAIDFFIEQLALARRGPPMGRRPVIGRFRLGGPESKLPG